MSLSKITIRAENLRRGDILNDLEVVFVSVRRFEVLVEFEDGQIIAYENHLRLEVERKLNER
jgi:hypothetical protein